MTKYSKYLPLLFAVVLLALPLVTNSYYFFRLFTTMGIYFILVTGLNVLQGYTGLVSIGQAGFYAVGAYSAGLLMRDLNQSFLVTLALVMIIGVVVGLFLGMVCLKLRQAYLAIVTLAFGLIVQTVAVNWNALTGGTEGFLAIPKANLLGFVINTPVRGYYLVLLLGIIAYLVVANVINSSWGRVLKAVRDDEIAANMMGINVVSTKLFAFVFSSVLAMISGTLYAGIYGGIFPGYFDMNLSVLFLCMMVVGGAGTLAGPAVGTILVTVSLESLRALGEGQMLVYGVIIVALCIFCPGGIAEIFAGLYHKFASKWPAAEGVTNDK